MRARPRHRRGGALSGVGSTEPPRSGGAGFAGAGAGSGVGSEKAVVRTQAAPAPFQGAPYNQAIRFGDFVFVAGQLGLVPGAGLAGDSVAEQTEQVFANLRAILEAAGSGLDKLVKTTVFLVDLGDFQAMNEVYARHVGESPPARSTVEVSRLPSDARVEIEAVAHV